ncbi:acyl-CoA dehydrogenase family protein [Salinibacterium sp. ZJ454]|uniref:acyl-CoA dehydrogenase family protein n=1 Tax=Salinibacterium sp. ZJ454 TaxID=2708339 RepID=UPI001423519E|nr:acyl-CoA dehydrogenase family protein [Salinibacterium sp. ZJ454]
MTQPALTTDWYRLSDELTDRERDLISTVRRFVDEEVTPVINDAWERARFPEEIIPKLSELGIVGTFISGYGCPGMTRREAGLVSLEMSRGDGSVNTFFGVHSGLTMGSIDLLGSDEQKQRWLPDMAALRKLGAFALTEPDHGSDSVALETSAVLDGDEYVLTGAKRWIGNAHRADVVVVWARDASDAKVKAFVVEREESGEFPAGFSAQIIDGKVGKRAIEQSHITIESVRIPAANLLAKSASFRDASAVLAKTRSGASWEAVGHAMACYEIALEYSKTRRQFGSPIAEYQLVQHRLAKMLAEITAMQMYCFRLAELGDTDRLDGSMSSLAKMYTAERGRWVCSEARDILGGNGMLLENHVARHLTDMEVVYTYEGTDSIQSLIVGRAITGVAAFGHRS